jgi:hypothetical protein
MSISGDGYENPGLEAEIEAMMYTNDCVHGFAVCEECAYDRGLFDSIQLGLSMKEWALRSILDANNVYAEYRDDREHHQKYIKKLRLILDRVIGVNHDN